MSESDNGKEQFEQVRRDAKDLAASARGLAEAEYHHLLHRLDAAKAATHDMMRQYYDRFEDYANDRPAKKMLRALAIGFAAGWLFGRRKRS